MRYSLGLDIGIASVGWAVLNKDKERIEDLGVRIFEKAEHPKNGKPLAQDRREKRGARRRNRRRAHRIERIKNLFISNGLITQKEIYEVYSSPNLKSPWELRVKALETKLSNTELVQILLHIAKRRGFKSNRKTEVSDKETGSLLSGIKENKQLMLDKGYLTVGEMVLKDEKFSEHKRNKQGSYNLSMPRDLLVEEVKTIYNKQSELGNTNFTSDILEKYLEIFSGQRNFDEGPSKPSPYFSENGQIAKMVGKCTFEKEKLRAPKNAYSSERFVLLQNLNNMTISSFGDKRKLKKGEKEKIIEEAYKKKELKYTAIRKLLALEENQRFSNLSYGKQDISKVENSKFISMLGNYSINKSGISVELSNKLKANTDKLDAVIEILTFRKSDKTITNGLKDLGISDDDITKLLEITFSGTLNLSFKAIKKILPYLEEGDVYSEACEKAGYDFRLGGVEFEKNVLLPALGKDVIANPVVLRAVSQTRKVVNAIIRKYGSPYTIHVEVARDLAKSYSERDKQVKANKKRELENNKTKEEIEALGASNVTGKLITKYRLYQEQDCKCIYSGTPLDLDRVINDPSYTDIDHIIPYSRSMDDSFNNKVLCLAGENRQKSNRTPREYMEYMNRDLDKFEKIVMAQKISYKKKENLLRKSFTREDSKDWKERNLNDTRYISRFISGYLSKALVFWGDELKKRVYMVPGKLTAQLRGRWGLTKNREESDLHHALDAATVAAVDQKMIHKISLFSKKNELKYAKDIDPSIEYYTDEDTGEILVETVNDKHFPLPWKGFRDELRMRLENENPSKHFDNLLKDKRYLAWFNYDEKFIKNLKPVFVSRMPRRKISGQAHEETIRSIRENIVVTKTPLQKVKLSDLERMQGKDTDRKLYTALKDRLEKFNNKPDAAFAEPFYKPTNNGDRGPVVKSIKLREKMNTGVEVNEGIAANGSMIRVDVFLKNKKYYMVPIYVHNTIENQLPNRAVVANKPYSKWDIIDDTYKFLFSFQKNDLIKIDFGKERKLKNYKTKENVYHSEFIGYYGGVDSATASISIEDCKNTTLLRIGSKTLKSIEKYEVGILGDIHKVRKELRKEFK